MFKNYLKTAYRNITKNKIYSLISILGLALGIAVCMLIFIWIQYQFTYNDYHEKIDNIYWLCSHHFYGENSSFSHQSATAIGVALKRDYPEVVDFARYRCGSNLLRYGENHFREKIRYTDPAYLSILTIDMLQGNAETALNDPYSIVLSEEYARKYFADQNPVGKTMTVDNNYDCVVTGVFSNTPENSTLKNSILMPLQMQDIQYGDGDFLYKWTNYSFYTILELQAGADYEALNGKIINLVNENHSDSRVDIFVFPFSRLHLHSITGEGGLITTLTVFMIIAMLILAVACINFINLMTARSTRRAKEVGLRKAIGANRGELIRQFLNESFIYTFLAAILALMLVEVMLPVFRQLVDDNFIFRPFSNSSLLLGIAGIVIFTSILSGIYPALALSSFRAVQVLKGGVYSGKNRSLFRKALVVTQFTVSIILIICTTVIYNQHNFMMSKELGFNKDEVIYLPLQKEQVKNYAALKTELLENPDILSVTRATHSPSGIWWNGLGWDWEGRDENVDPWVTYLGVSDDFLETFEIEMAEGKYYAPDKAESNQNYVILNQKFTDIIGKGEAVAGRQIRQGSDSYQIMGVINDFHYKPVYSTLDPIILFYEPDRSYKVFIKTSPKNMPATVAFVREVWNRHLPQFPFELNFLDEEFEELYDREKSAGDILIAFAILTIFICCLGLFGLSAYSAEQRTKEIGIRKVLGATVNSILGLLSKEFLILVLIANFVAAPLAYVIMLGWLQGFPYRISFSPLFILAAAGMALAIALLTVSFQAVKAASSNPLESLRYE